ncbi:hypothetical protein STEG23_016049 [Scotinomys teguina]
MYSLDWNTNDAKGRKKIPFHGQSGSCGKAEYYGMMHTVEDLVVSLRLRSREKEEDMERKDEEQEDKSLNTDSEVHPEWLTFLPLCHI